VPSGTGILAIGWLVWPLRGRAAGSGPDALANPCESALVRVPCSPRRPLLREPQTRLNQDLLDQAGRAPASPVCPGSNE